MTADSDMHFKISERPKTPQEARRLFRAGSRSHTRGVATGYLQCGLAVMPQADVAEFALFCSRNARSLSILDMTAVGSFRTKLAPDADLRTDLPLYNVYRDGRLSEQVADIVSLWQEDFVALLFGCSLTFDAALAANGIPNRLAEENRGPTMYLTNIDCEPVARYRGRMIVSMRPMLPGQAIRAIQVTSRFPATHGAPVHFGTPSAIGIADLNKPDIGVSVTVKPGEIPVFWACIATIWDTIEQSRPPFIITHAPGCLFITDRTDESIAVF